MAIPNPVPVYQKNVAEKMKELIDARELKMHNVFNYFITKKIFISEKHSFYNSN